MLNIAKKALVHCCHNITKVTCMVRLIPIQTFDLFINIQSNKIFIRIWAITKWHHLCKRLYRVNLFIKKFLHSTAHLFSAFHIYVGYQSGFSLKNSVEYTKIIISLFCASRWNGNLWWNPSIASYCIVGHTFNLLLLLCNYSYQLSVGEDIFVRMEF